MKTQQMGYVTARILKEYIANMASQINLTWQNMSVRTEQAGRIARIVKSYKQNSGFHILSTTSRVGPGVTVFHLPH
jgi:hypothetical protein